MHRQGENAMQLAHYTLHVTCVTQLVLTLRQYLELKEVYTVNEWQVIYGIVLHIHKYQRAKVTSKGLPNSVTLDLSVLEIVTLALSKGSIMSLYTTSVPSTDTSCHPKG